MKRRQEVRSFGNFAHDLDELADWLESQGVTQVAMEATGVYWKPIWHVLEDRSFELMLVNPTHVKKVPGRKTDLKDAEWIAQLLECGLLRGSFVPPEAIRDLRDLTRYRKKLIQDRARESNRGVDMSVFPTSGHLASWAGMCPGNNESAGKHLSGRTRKGDPWLSGLVTECGWAARQTKGTYLAAQFWQIARRRGQEKAAVAVGHTILVIAWHILIEGATYQGLGGDWFDRRRDPEAQQRRLVRQLEAVGLKVTIETAAA